MIYIGVYCEVFALALCKNVLWGRENVERAKNVEKLMCNISALGELSFNLTIIKMSNMHFNLCAELQAVTPELKRPLSTACPWVLP